MKSHAKPLLAGIIVGAALVITISGYFFTHTTHRPYENNTASVTIEDHARGSLSAPAVLVEYSDFQCPSCGTVEPLLRKLEKEFGQDLAIVYRHFPLSDIHPHAQYTAQASEAAAQQNKFWEFHDLLLDRQNSWTNIVDVRSTMTDYAKELQLNREKFIADIESQKIKDRIKRDVELGLAVNIPGTPTFYLNGKKILPATLGEFKQLIQQQISAVN